MMLGEPRLIQHNVTITFARHAGIRRRANDLEDALGRGCPNGFLSPQLIPVPDEMGPDVPRMIFSSRNGFSQILVSQVAISLLVSYSEDWQTDHPRCVDYIRHRATVLFNLLSAIDAKPHYTGVMTKIQMLARKPGDDGVLAVRKLLKHDEIGGDFNEINVRWSRVEEPGYFRNMVIQSLRSWGPEAFETGRLRDLEATMTGVEIVSDANDRRSYNEIDDYSTSSKACLKVIDLGYEDTRTWAHRIGGSDVH